MLRCRIRIVTSRMEATVPRFTSLFGGAQSAMTHCELSFDGAIGLCLLAASSTAPAMLVCILLISNVRGPWNVFVQRSVPIASYTFSLACHFPALIPRSHLLIMPYRHRCKLSWRSVSG